MIYYLSSVQSKIINNIVYSSLLEHILLHHRLPTLNVKLKILNILVNMQWVSTRIQSQSLCKKIQNICLGNQFYSEIQITNLLVLKKKKTAYDALNLNIT